MPASRPTTPIRSKLDALRTEFADLAYQLEREGRCDAADVVMLIDTRVRELSAEIDTEEPARSAWLEDDSP